MRIKKGFTLAEILIVLMVIGIIAVMTIPGLMAGVTEARMKTAFKKAYNNIVNLVAMGTLDGGIPANPSGTNDAGLTGTDQLMIYLARNLSVKGFVNEDVFDNGKLANPGSMVSTIEAGTANTKYGAPDGDSIKLTTGNDEATRTWIVTDDGLSYTAFSNTITSNKACGPKLAINALKVAPYNEHNERKGPCFFIIVDTTGIFTGPNLLQGRADDSGEQYFEAETDATPRVTKDQFYIYVGSDGATAGNPKMTLSGRIIGDVK